MRHSAHAPSVLLAVCLAASGCDPSAPPSDASEPPEQTRSVGQALDEQSVAAARDTYVEQNAGTITDYDNFGAESGLIVGTNPKDRALVAMDEAAIATAVGGGTVVSARLILTVQSAVWGGQLVGGCPPAHRSMDRARRDPSMSGRLGHDQLGRRLRRALGDERQ